jgi:hypothetical protein
MSLKLSAVLAHLFLSSPIPDTLHSYKMKRMCSSGKRQCVPDAADRYCSVKKRKFIILFLGSLLISRSLFEWNCLEFLSFVSNGCTLWDAINKEPVR